MAWTIRRRRYIIPPPHPFRAVEHPTHKTVHNKGNPRQTEGLPTKSKMNYYLYVRNIVKSLIIEYINRHSMGRVICITSDAFTSQNHFWYPIYNWIDVGAHINYFQLRLDAVGAHDHQIDRRSG